MIIYIIILILLTSFYVFINIRYVFYWKRYPVFIMPNGWQPRSTVQIIVPARNEADNIARVLEALLTQQYPTHLYEVFLIDDHSTDSTVALACALQQKYKNLKILHLANYIDENNTNSHKKKAIEYALQHSKAELVVTTDADCTMGAEWLATLVAYMEMRAAALVAAPVLFDDGVGVLGRFQQLDMAGMMGITAAGFELRQLLCNGANLAYHRDVFEAVEGFRGIDELASGDDMFLLHKIAAAYPTRVFYLKNRAATVSTQPKKTWRGLWQQRLRWATKTGSYDQQNLQWTVWLVGLFLVSIVANMGLGLCCGTAFWGLASLQLLAKSAVDFYLLYATTRFWNKTHWLWAFVPSVLVHTFYLVAVGVGSQFCKRYEWKGRRVR